MQNKIFICIINTTKLLSIFTILILNGCAYTKEYSSITELTPSNEIKKIAVMPIDVTLSILTAGGLLEPQAEWSKAAKRNIQTAMKSIDVSRSSSFIKYVEPKETELLYDTIIEHERLHRAVG